MPSLRELYNEGYRRVCLNPDCNTVFKPDRVREEFLDTSIIEMCRCGCDLIGHIIENGNGKLYICKEPKISKDCVC